MHKKCAFFQGCILHTLTWGKVTYFHPCPQYFTEVSPTSRSNDRIHKKCAFFPGCIFHTFTWGKVNYFHPCPPILH